MHKHPLVPYLECSVARLELWDRLYRVGQIDLERMLAAVADEQTRFPGLGPTTTGSSSEPRPAVQKRLMTRMEQRFADCSSRLLQRLRGAQAPN